MADTIKQRVLLVHARAMSGTSKKTNNRYEMCTVEYLSTDNLSPVKDKERDDFGYQILTESLPYECKHNIDIVPAFYDLEFEVSVAFNNGKAQTSLRPIGISYVSPLTPDKAAK